MEKKLLQIINHYGIRNQQRKLNEEVFELNEAIINRECYEDYLPYEYADQDYRNYLKGHITEEIADIEVMLLQFKEYYQIDGNDILRIMNEKIDRQLRRMEE